ncbi:MucR family transcriptional regulator [Brevundimonas sp.]|uniref:MucR family transcriptional regulator n=1 Tax=Brevundimonas sp. TaxID=1871086 RepID=UPI0035B34F61
MDQEHDQTDLLDLTATVISNYVSNNRVEASELPALISSVHTSLAGLGKEPEPEEPEVEKPTPAQIRRSISDDYLTSFIDGRKYRTLRRHLTTNGMTPDEYRERYGLKADYPLVAPAYSRARSEMAKSIGLGSKGRGKTPAKAPRKPRTPRAKGTAG